MLVWVDLEMTGLDLLRDQILEIAVVVTSDDLRDVAEGPDIVVGCEDSILKTMDDTVKEMHHRSGLLDAVQRSEVSSEQAEVEVLEFLAGAGVERGESPLCGNSIAYDRAFLSIHMTELNRYLHYRNIDVSSLRCLAERWAPEVQQSEPAKKKSHRALDDIRESISQLRHYQPWMFNHAVH